MMYFITAFGLGIVSSIHCIGMCGPIVVLIKQNSKSAGILPNYHIGRILGYTILGLLFGIFGKGLSIAGLQQQLSIIIGIVMVLSISIPWLRKKSKLIEISLFPYHRKFKELFAKNLGLGNPKNRFFIGILNSLLPCGMIYMALVGALNATKIWHGSLFMFCFGLGTLPLFSLLLYTQDSIKSTVFKVAMNKAQSVLIMMMGIALIARGWGLGFHYSPSFGDLSIASFKACLTPF